MAKDVSDEVSSGKEKKVSKKENNKDVKKDTFEIPVGSYLSKARENPWIVTSIVLAILLVGSLFFSSGSGMASEQEVEENVLGFLNSQVEGDVTLESVDWNDGGYYEIVVGYQGDAIPFFVTSDGKNIITDLVSVDSMDAGETDADTGTGRVSFEIPDGVYTKGSEDAPITIIEFSDFECPFCERFYSETLDDLEANYVDTGLVRLVFMHFPLSFHPEAMPAAVASECAGELGGQDAFWMMHDLLFENQNSLGRDSYIMWAGELGLDSGAFESCIDSGRYDSKIASHMALGSSSGIGGTPGFLVGSEDYVLVSGAQPFSVFEQVVNSELA